MIQVTKPRRLFVAIGEDAAEIVTTVCAALLKRAEQRASEDAK
jgi:hypothetical protein